MKKQLLNESEIRKMMKFANIGALSNGFVEKIHETYYGDDDVPEGMMSEEEDDPAAAADLGGPDMGADAALDPGMGDTGEAPDADPMADTEPEAPGMEAEADADPEVVKAAVMTIIDGLKEKLQELYGEAAPDLEATEDEGAEDMPPEGIDAGAPDMGAEMAPPEEEDPAGLEEDFINEMTRKVASRLVKAARR